MTTGTRNIPASTKFEIDGINHLALVSSDMKRTVDFYTGVLGFPLVKTLELGGGRGQHFFFDISEGNGIAFFWFPHDKEHAPGLANAGWDPVTGLKTVASAHGTMHHLSFEVPKEKLDEYAERLRAAGVEVTRKIGTAALEDGDEACIETIYFPDPDGFVLGFSAWTRALTPEDVRHAPATAVVVKSDATQREREAAAG